MTERKGRGSSRSSTQQGSPRPTGGTRRRRTPTAAQVSSGGVIYREVDASAEVALIAYTGRGGEWVWCLPKGGVEPNESLEQTAQREVWEETGLAGDVEGKLGAIQYWYYGRQERVRYHKSVHFFLLRYREGRIEDHDREAEEVRWFPLGTALDRLTYENERSILLGAAAAIERRRRRRGDTGAPRAAETEGAEEPAGGREPRG